jgi:hypothetical protein
MTSHNDDHSVVSSIVSILERTGLTYSQLAAACGISPATARAVMLTARMPARLEARTRLERWVRANEKAVARTDVHFI